MPITAQGLADAANYVLMTYADNDPVDQFTAGRPFFNWLLEKKKASFFTSGIFNETIRINDSSSYMNYSYDDQVGYGVKDTIRQAPFQSYEAHDGFGMNETDLANKGIIVTSDTNTVTTRAERQIIVDQLKENYETLKSGFQRNFDLEMHRDGTQSTKAAPGLDALISTTPGTGVVGGLDPATYTFWQNRATLNISTTVAGTLVQAMEKAWRDCMVIGGMEPDAIFCGGKFFDAYRNDAPLTVNRQIQLAGADHNPKGGFTVDNGAKQNGVFFKGVPLIYDPTFDTLQSLLNPTVNWDKRCYFLNSKSIRLRPSQGRWMINRNPARIYDRYVHYMGLTSAYGLTVNQRNNQAVLSIA